jgi:hypothetical protein
VHKPGLVRRFADYSPSHPQAPHVQQVHGAHRHGAQLQHAQADGVGVCAVDAGFDVFMG